MGTPGLSVALLLLAGLAAAGVILWGAAGRRREADRLLSNASTEADRLRTQAQRDAESLRKEAALEAREAAHALTAAADERIRQRQDLEVAAGGGTSLRLGVHPVLHGSS